MPSSIYFLLILVLSLMQCVVIVAQPHPTNQSLLKLKFLGCLSPYEVWLVITGQKKWSYSSVKVCLSSSGAELKSKLDTLDDKQRLRNTHS